MLRSSIPSTAIGRHPVGVRSQRWTSFHLQRRFGLDPSNDSPPDEVSEPVEGVLGHGVSEVFSPAACDPIDPDQHGSKVLL
jgi:hypothetical protein